MRKVKIIYKDTKSSKKMFQEINVSDMAAAVLAEEMDEHENGKVDKDTYLYCLLSACQILACLEQFQGKPDFMVQEFEWADEVLHKYTA